MTAFICSILEDAFFAAVAGTGFAIIGNPPARTLLVSALLAAFGHGTRYFLMNAPFLHAHICIASFGAALLIGLLAVFFSQRQSVSAEVYAFPSLLPMIPGMFAYRTVQALAYYLATGGSENESLHYINQFFYNGLTAVCILFLLVTGTVIPMQALQKIRYSSNRQRPK